MTELLANPLYAALAVLLGGAALVAGGESLVRGATKIALGLRVSPLVVGLTVVALCTSAPEMAVSFSAVLKEDPTVADVALGNVVGSNICNILLILGVCALIKPLKSSEAIVKRDFPVCALLSFATLVAAQSFRRDDGSFLLPQWFGIALLATFIVYEIATVKQARREENSKFADSVEFSTLEKESARNLVETAKATTRVNWFLAIAQVLFGLAALVVGAQGFVDGSVSIARALHVSELIIGLTLVALGTSLPELTVSIVATVRNQVDVAMGNVVGSNICNLALILGGSVALLPGGMTIQRHSAFVDLPVMLATTVVAAWFCLTDRKLSRMEGAVLVAGQIAYAAYLVL